ncbi:MAG: carboxypeptidase-like regulatory domain-containing protein [Acidobacteriota bacterium]|nr:carboxypeptidase-like regulatory domain-containing protein [Acidobacteriota bacterium]
MMQRSFKNKSEVGFGALLFVLLFLSMCKIAPAQSNEGSISGNVTDPSGALVPGAQITAKGVNTGATYQTVSSTSGGYNFANLRIGAYDITANAPGFSAASVKGVIVQVGTTSSLNITLATGNVNQTVTVSGDAPTIETESADVGTVVTTKQVLDLPLALGSTVQAMRSPEAFVFLTPGTVGPGTNGSGSNGASTGGAFQSKVSGGQNYGTEIILDGASTYRSENGSSFDEAAPSVEALSEFRVETSTMPADLGRTTGGIEIFSTKSGTNSFHGDAYDLFRNEDLDANSWFNNYQGLPRVLDKQNDYGGTLGGPVWIPKIYNGKNKSFFFFSWEQYRQNQGGVSTTTVPTAAEKNGDFSSTLNRNQIVGANPCDGTNIYAGEIFDPSTTRIGAGGAPCRTSYLSETGKNAIPSSQFSPIGQKLLSYYPNPLNSNATNNYSLPFSFPLLDTTMTIRGDQNLGDRDKLFASYTSRDNNRFSTNPIFDNPGGQGRNQDFFTHYIRAGNDFTITPSLFDHLNVGFNRTNSKNVGAGVRLGNGANWDQVLGIAGASGPMFPGIGAGESTITGFGDNVDNDTIDYGWRVNDILDWASGKHDMKFGVDYRYQIYEPGSINNTSGTFNFGRAETAGTTGGAAGLSGNGVASMLLGQIDNANLVAYASQAKWLSHYYALFMEDSYKASSTLTVNYGLRWEVDSPRHEAHGNTSNLSLSAPNPAAAGLPGALVFAGKGPGRNGSVSETWAYTWPNDFAPRVGFAWAPAAAHNKTVFRGGFAIYYGAITYADFGNDLQTGFQSNPTLSSPDGFSPAFNLASGFPAYKAPPNLDPSQANFAGNPANAYVDSSYGRPAMVNNWSFDIQQQLATDLILDVGYVGQHSTHLRSSFDPINSLNPSYFGLGQLLNSPVGSPQAQAAGIKLPYAGFSPTRNVAESLLQFPQLFAPNTDCCLENLGQSSYDAFELRLQRRFHSGLNLLASYTWSKTITDADSVLPAFASFSGGGSIQNPFNLKGEKSLSNQDIPQNLVLSYIYELPFGKGKKFLNHGAFANAVLGGWSVSGIQTYHSGQPENFCCASGIPFFTGAIRYDLVPGQQIFSQAFLMGNYNPVTDSIFNKAAFIDPNAPARIQAGGAFQLGDSPRTLGSVRSFFYTAEDFNLLKRTQLSEHSDILLQVSLLDAFNRHIFDNHVNVDRNPNDANFGIMNPNDVILGPRRIQIQLKLEF